MPFVHITIKLVLSFFTAEWHREALHQDIGGQFQLLLQGRANEAAPPGTGHKLPRLSGKALG